ncbi:hypothetical protein LX16_1058 [Stackebrandtia albiflava]|uniref:Peptidase inhibitor family I36 n=1 Tax=Stackebrandtia albiflava TaxID=406432 RepID=A0A562VC07_9ACTN|nr:DUF6289 family protein [Stackebrandtia albiflava]TWJ15357.1 hypothetical protein LX16_1058 [Stackebrandtia albiflava]
MPTLARRLIATAAVAACTTTVAIAAATPAAAIPACRYDYQCTYTWYTDADRDTVAGGMTLFCDGTSDRFGRQTSYLAFHTVQCG